jgi:tetratricopeptide (TPR) repeat protein
MTEIPASCLAEAARALMLAGRWLEATELLRAATATDEGERSVLAEAVAEVAVEQDFWIRTDIGSRALDHAFAVRGSSHELEFLQLKHDYNQRAWAAFYAGLIADVLSDDESAGRAAYSQALADGTEAGDDLVVSYALRHLGDLDARAGSVDAAREQLAQSLEVRQRLGCVPHALAQQLALAELAHDSGDVSWAQTVAGQVHAWALALPGDPWLVPASAELL